MWEISHRSTQKVEREAEKEQTAYCPMGRGHSLGTLGFVCTELEMFEDEVNESEH